MYDIQAVEEIEDKLKEILFLLNGILSQTQTDSVSSLMYAGEWNLLVNFFHCKRKSLIELAKMNNECSPNLNRSQLSRFEYGY